MGIGKPVQAFEIKNVAGGCNYTDDITELPPEQSPDSLNVEFINGRIRKRKGYTAINTSVGGNAAGLSLIDFGSTSGTHKQVAHLGDTVYAFNSLTSSRVTLRANAPRTRSYNAKIKNYLIQTYNDYSAPYYWDGTASSMSVLSANAPGFKRSIEFQGYLMGMNTEANPLRIYYQSTGNLIGATYSDYLTLTPAPNDDEITDPFLLNGRLYIGTQYSIFRMSFVGGTTVFEYKQVISDVGIVPNTVQLVVTKDYGQVALFLGTDKRIYMFDGANMKAVSDLYYYHNDETPISMDLIDDHFIENSFAVFDNIRRVYRLFVTKRAQGSNYYCINVHVDTFAYYPFDNMPFSAGAMCYDALQRPVLTCADYTGRLHKMFIDTNTDNGVGINEYYTSPMVSVKDQMLKQGQTVIVHMIPVSSANLLMYERIDFKRVWALRQAIPLSDSRDKFLGTNFVLNSSPLGSEKSVIHPQVGINITFNHYQVKLQCDEPTAAPWEVFSITVNQTVTVFGEAEPQR